MMSTEMLSPSLSLHLLCFLCCAALLGAASASFPDLKCDFFMVFDGFLDSDINKCTKWNSFEEAKQECLATRDCDGFSMSKVGPPYDGCIKGNRKKGFEFHKDYHGYHKTIMGCCGTDIFDLRGDGSCAGRQEKVVSLNKPAQQSSTYWGAASTRAVDGDKNPDFEGKSCTHTRAQTNPWWQVDLLQSYDITKVYITNRGDCCAHRLSDFEIRIGDERDPDKNPVCQKGLTLGTGETEAFDCQMGGRYVNIHIEGKRRILTLCEVEVIANVPAHDELGTWIEEMGAGSPRWLCELSVMGGEGRES